MDKVFILMIVLAVFLGGLWLADSILNPIIMRGFYNDYKSKGGKKTFEQYKKMFESR